jgi:hypothetical protein
VFSRLAAFERWVFLFAQKGQNGPNLQLFYNYDSRRSLFQKDFGENVGVLLVGLLHDVVE